MTDSDGNAVLAGNYEIVGVSHGAPVIPVGASWPDDPVTNITIVPEPGMVGVVSVGLCFLLRRRTRQLSVASVPVPPHGHLPRTVTRLP
jgi:hypothetical protein